MGKRKKRKLTGLSAEEWAEHERVQRLLAERIAYHQAKAEEERALRDPKAS
jgi:hypothetical protein